jgi:hypothetical protein
MSVFQIEIFIESDTIEQENKLWHTNNARPNLFLLWVYYFYISFVCDLAYIQPEISCCCVHSNVSWVAVGAASDILPL